MNEVAGPPRRTRAFILLASLLVLCAPVFLYRLGRPALGDPDEGRNAEVAREMLATGEWVTPHINGARYLDKPPAFFWTVAASFRVVGVNELGARLPSALFAFLTVALVFDFIRRRLGPRAGFLAGAVLALSPLYIVFARTVIFDMMLTFCMTGSGLAAFAALEGDDARPGACGAGALRRALAGGVFFAAAGLGTITKGPVALVAPLLVATAWALAGRRPGALRRLGFGPGLAIYAAIVLPWVTVVALRNPGYLRYAIIGENLQRMMTDTFETSQPFYWYAGIVLPGFFPWILYAGAAAGRWLWRGLRAGRAGGAMSATDRLERYALIWFGTLFLFFSLIHSKRPSYMLPLAVPIALLAGCLWDRLAGGRCAGEGAGRTDASRKDLAAGAWLVALACLMLGAAFLLAGPGGRVRGISHGKYNELLSRAGLFGLTAAGLALVAIAIVWTRRGRRPLFAFLAAASAVAVMVPLARAVIGHIDATRSSRSVSLFLAGRIGADDTVICFNEYRPGLNFYLRRPIYLVSDPGRIFTSNYIKMHFEEFRSEPDFRLIPIERLGAFLGSVRGAFVVAPRRSYDTLRMTAGLPLRIAYEDAVGAVFVPDGGALGR